MVFLGLSSGEIWPSSKFYVLPLWKKMGQNWPKLPILGTKSCVFGGSGGLPRRVGLVPVRVFRTLLDGEVCGWCTFFIVTVQHFFADVAKRVIFGRIMTREGRF